MYFLGKKGLPLQKVDFNFFPFYAPPPTLRSKGNSNGCQRLQFQVDTKFRATIGQTRLSRRQGGHRMRKLRVYGGLLPGVSGPVWHHPRPFFTAARAACGNLAPSSVPTIHPPKNRSRAGLNTRWAHTCHRLTSAPLPRFRGFLPLEKCTCGSSIKSGCICPSPHSALDQVHRSSSWLELCVAKYSQIVSCIFSKMFCPMSCQSCFAENVALEEYQNLGNWSKAANGKPKRFLARKIRKLKKVNLYTCTICA